MPPRAGPRSPRPLPAPVREALAKAGVPSPRWASWSSPSPAASASSRTMPTGRLNPASAIKLVTPSRRWTAGPRARLPHGRPRHGRGRGRRCSRATSSQGRRRPQAHLRAAVAARAATARAGPARDPRRRDPRPLYFAPRGARPRQVRRGGAAAYNVGPDALLVNFKAVDFRFVPAGHGRAGAGRARLPQTSRSRAA